MKILLTGAAGFIGNSIAQDLLKKGYEIVTIGKSEPSNLDCTHINMDLLTPDFITIEKIGAFDTLIHCSFIMASSENVDDINVLNHNNKVSENIVKISEVLSINHLINLSSIAVYPNIDGEYTEDSPINTSFNNDCIYGLSKICAEHVFNYFLTKKKNIPVTNLRISQVYGEGMRQDRTYYIMKDELLSKNQITVWSNGERVSNFIQIDKVIDAIHFFITHKDNAGIYNLGGKNLSYKDLALELISAYGNEKSEIILIDKGIKSKCFINTKKIDQLLIK